MKIEFEEVEKQILTYVELSDLKHASLLMQLHESMVKKLEAEVGVVNLGTHHEVFTPNGWRRYKGEL